MSELEEIRTLQERCDPRMGAYQHGYIIGFDYMIQRQRAAQPNLRIEMGTPELADAAVLGARMGTDDAVRWVTNGRAFVYYGDR